MTDPEIKILQDLVKRQSRAIDDLIQRVLYLERENKRRRSEIQQIPTK
jgi:hypothetical protein